MEIDFVLQQNIVEAKAFTYDTSLAGTTVKLTVFKPVPVDLPGVISGVGNNIVTFLFDNTVNADLGVFEYKVIQDPASGPDLELTRGNISYLPANNFTFQIHTLIQGESLGLTVDPNFETQSIAYWKLYLQPQFEIADADVQLDTAWPVLARFLIAKLVIHSYIVSLIKGSISSSFGSSTEEGETVVEMGQIKKMKTGPSEAEWYDGNKALTSITTTGATGKSTFDQLAEDICSLAERLHSYIPMCGQPANIPIVPIKGTPQCVDINTLILTYGG